MTDSLTCDTSSWLLSDPRLPMATCESYQAPDRRRRIASMLRDRLIERRHSEQYRWIGEVRPTIW